MLKKQIDSAQIMTIQNLDSLDTKDGETMQNPGDKSSNHVQQQLTAKNGHISFSVASLLADTRPARSVSPSASQNSSTIPSTSPQLQSSDEEYDSNQEDSIVDVEDLESEIKSESDSPRKNVNEFTDQRDTDFSNNNKDTNGAESMMTSQGPIRPTPFSALAAAVYQAAHPNWSHQSMVNPFGTPGNMFPGPAPFGVPNMSAGIYKHT
ncbi:hypothetical protein WA026_022043 [Henosepilachna vigintioctopunctata]|uniref:Uncharacterized protein n=1 Tax=Henosepilachna vigintioctopunctata TaxID=420089 RepID=A0AAW1V506_9CUCU